MIMGRRDRKLDRKWRRKIFLKRKAEFSNHKSCSIVPKPYPKQITYIQPNLLILNPAINSSNKKKNAHTTGKETVRGLLLCNKYNFAFSSKIKDLFLHYML